MPVSLPGWLAAVGADGDLDALAAHLARRCPRRSGCPFRLIAKRDERPRDRLAGVVADGGDASLVEVLEDHALEQVVDVALGERQIDPRVAFHLAASGK